MDQPFQNPYLAEFEACPDIQRDANVLKLLKKYAWAVPTREAIEAIARFAPIIEIGAGAGYWTWLLRQLGVEVASFDVEPIPQKDGQHRSVSELRFTEVLQGDEQKILGYPDHTLFLCYPPTGHPVGSNCLKLYQRQHLIYVGPTWRAGQESGDLQFHATLENEWDLAEKVEIPRYACSDDCVFIYKRLPADQHRNWIDARGIAETRRWNNISG